MSSVRRPGPADRAGQAFEELTGRPAQGVWSAPGRVNLIGEHLDYNAGTVLPFAIHLRTAVAAGRREDGWLRAVSSHPGCPELAVPVAALAPGSVKGWGGYVAGVVWALRRSGLDLGSGFDVVVDGDVPVGSGLSSSAALECAAALAVADLAGSEAAGDPDHLARVAQQAEHDFVGVPCGLMDQMTSMAAAAGHALSFDTRSGRVERLPLDPAPHGLSLLVIDTHVRHALADGEYRARRRQCEEAAARLGVPALRDVDPEDLDRALARLADRPELVRRVRHVVTEQDRTTRAAALLKAGRLAAIGPLLDASHRSLRHDFEVSCRELDAAVDTARRAGAIGARLTGAGFGGCAIALVPTGSVDDVIAAAGQLDGATAFTVTPAGGARQDR